MVGQLSAYKKPMPLSHEFEEFVTSSGHGFIIVSFGSNVGAISKEKVDILATAFGKLKQKVVWRLKGKLVTFSRCSQCCSLASNLNYSSSTFNT